MNYLSNKVAIDKEATITERCNSILLKNAPPNMMDPGQFIIPCKITETPINGGLCDLGASVSVIPLSVATVARRSNIYDLKPTKKKICLADGSLKIPIGIMEDVPIKVGRYYVPCDFFVLNVDENKETPIILGRLFLATAGTEIDVKNGKITMAICGDVIEINLPNSVKAELAENEKNKKNSKVREGEKDHVKWSIFIY